MFIQAAHDSIRQAQAQKLRAGTIRLPNESEQAAIDAVIEGLDTYSYPELRRSTPELRKRKYFIDESIGSPGPDEKIKFGYTYPTIYKNTVFLAPVNFSGLALPDLSQNMTFYYTLADTMLHENLHLRYHAQGRSKGTGL